MPNYNAGDNKGSFKYRTKEEVRELGRKGGLSKKKKLTPEKEPKKTKITEDCNYSNLVIGVDPAKNKDRSHMSYFCCGCKSIFKNRKDFGKHISHEIEAQSEAYEMENLIFSLGT